MRLAVGVVDVIAGARIIRIVVPSVGRTKAAIIGRTVAVAAIIWRAISVAAVIAGARAVADADRRTAIAVTAVRPVRAVTVAIAEAHAKAVISAAAERHRAGGEEGNVGNTHDYTCRLAIGGQTNQCWRRSFDAPEFAFTRTA